MSFAGIIRRILRPVAEPLLAAIAARLGRDQHLEAGRRFDLNLFLALRAVAGRGDHRVVLPHDAVLPRRALKDLKIGFFGNIANNAYNFVRCLRRLGYNAELVLEDGWFDTFLMNRPFWEDVEVRCKEYDDGLAYERNWVQPSCVRRVAYDGALQQQFQGRWDAISEVQGLYKQAFGVELPPDTALILAQQMGHWPYLLSMSRYDVIQFSGAPISMGLFCPKPYIVFPTGSDLFISPFEESSLGMLMRTGYRNARHILVCETNYPEYLSRLQTTAPQTFAPMMVDTDTYVPGKGGDIRDMWIKESGGERFILGVCRQSWEWKGSDRLIRAFESFVAQPHNRHWRLVLMEWGPDADRTKSLITELKLERYVLWQNLVSKPLLRKYQQAADLVADQFVMAGYGTSVLESMAAGKAVLLARQDVHAYANFRTEPPFLYASTSEEVVKALSEITEEDGLVRRGDESLQWVHTVHGYRSAGHAFIQAYESVLNPSDRPVPIADRVGPHSSSSGLLGEIQRLHRELRKAMMEKYRRSVPLGDELTDRWERARFLGFGEATSIYDSALVLGDVRVGKNTWIGPDCILDGSGGLEIGSNCSVASGCHLYSHDTVEWALSGGNCAYQRAPTRIGDACYLGPHSVIASGVTIGNHCLIGALSLVNRDVPDNSIAVGIPAQIIGRVEVGPDFRITLVYEETGKQ